MTKPESGTAPMHSPSLIFGANMHAKRGSHARPLRRVPPLWPFLRLSILLDRTLRIERPLPGNEGGGHEDYLCKHRISLVGARAHRNPIARAADHHTLTDFDQ